MLPETIWCQKRGFPGQQLLLLQAEIRHTPVEEETPPQAHELIMCVLAGEQGLGPAPCLGQAVNASLRAPAASAPLLWR